MVSDSTPASRLARALEPLGPAERTLAIGRFPIRIVGLARELAEGLDRRWGGFLAREPWAEPRLTLALRKGGAGFWLAAPRPGEPYRIESTGHPGEDVVASYHFALGPEPGGGSWRVGITPGADEPAPRILDNVLRVVVARLAVAEGGFALHAAGVLHEGRAYLFAGPSRAGKSTVSRALAPAVSMGDDFALVLPERGAWSAPALPFDNSERAPEEPPRGLYPVACIFRLFQANATRIEAPPAGRTTSSLLACVALPWTYPALGAALLEQVERFVRAGAFRHLHFTRDGPRLSDLLQNGG